jgi:SAM-dependent methyltransferase
MNRPSLSRKFLWQSSRVAAADDVSALQRRMIDYYSQDNTRTGYQNLLGLSQTSQPQVLYALTHAIADERPNRVLELGCGSGWILDELKSLGVSPSNYIGAELSKTVIESNRIREPQATWLHLTGYEVDQRDESVDVAFSYFVLEHCVYPDRHLHELYRVLRPGGAAYVVCPNFVALGILPSQALGIADDRASILLKRGRIFAAALALYDSRIRLRRALAKLRPLYGDFVLNMNPVCLSDTKHLVPDTDAVFIATDDDFSLWSREHGAVVSKPKGNTGAFRAIHYVELRKPN